MKVRRYRSAVIVVLLCSVLLISFSLLSGCKGSTGDTGSSTGAISGVVTGSTIVFATTASSFVTPVLLMNGPIHLPPPATMTIPCRAGCPGAELTSVPPVTGHLGDFVLSTDSWLLYRAAAPGHSHRRAFRQRGPAQGSAAAEDGEGPDRRLRRSCGRSPGQQQ